MTTEKVQARITVKSENFDQVFEESVLDSSTTEQSSSYESLIAANERLRTNLSKVLTEFVNKARLEQEANGGDQKKRKIKRNDHFYLVINQCFLLHIDDDDEEEDGEDDEDAESSDNNEDEP